MSVETTRNAGRCAVTEPLVLLPGFMCDARLWGAQIEALSPSVSILMPSLGAADNVEEMAGAVLGMAPKRFALAGHSLGAAVAMEILRRAPDRVSRIALMSTTCLAETPSYAADRETRIARVRAGRLDTVMQDEVPKFSLAPGPMRDQVAEFIVDMARAMGTEAYIRQSRAMQRRPDQQATLRRARLPALVICGEHDELVLPRRHEFMAELMPRARLVKTTAGHLPSVEAPQAVNKALADWMARETEPLLLK